MFDAHKRRQFLKEISITSNKSVFLVVAIFFIKSSLPLEGIIGSTFRKK